MNSDLNHPYKLPELYLARVIQHALEEDIGNGDVTTTLLIPEGTQARMQLTARSPLVLCGTDFMQLVFDLAGRNVKVHGALLDGTHVEKNTALLVAEGDARTLLIAERTALNLLQRLCGIATTAAEYVAAVTGTKAVILDTRKTMPGLRLLDKYAVRMGGAQNHRFGLYDMVLIKDNHIALSGNITEAVNHARAGTTLPVEVECDTLAQVEEALDCNIDRILLDNMTNDQLKQAVALSAGRVKLEASGGVNLKTVRAIAETGVDYISVGALTHSVIAADIGADISMSIP